MTLKEKHKVDAWSEDPVEQRLAVAYLAADNANALKKYLGRDPTDAEQYAAWFLGFDGAKTFLAGLGKDENVPATDYASPIAVNSNKDMFYKYHMEGKEKVYDDPRTAKELFTLLQKKVGTGTTPAPMPEKVKFILPTDPNYNSADQHSYHDQFKHFTELYAKPGIRVLPAWPPSSDPNGKR